MLRVLWRARPRVLTAAFSTDKQPRPPKAPEEEDFSSSKPTQSPPPPNPQLDEAAKKFSSQKSNSSNQSKGRSIKWREQLLLATFAYISFRHVYENYVLKPQKPAPPDNQNITVLPKGVSIGGEWKFLNEKGQEETDQDYNGKYVVYYFGYTHCPEICPTSLRKMAQAIELLKTKEGLKIEFLFISLDPERDTPEMVGKYAKLFHPMIHGLVVPATSLEKTLKQFKLFSTRIPIEGGGYNLDHTNYMYLMSPTNQLITVLGYDLKAEDLFSRISKLTN